MNDDDRDGETSDEPDFEYVAGFVGPCACDHAPEEHGWGSCDVDGCSCEAGWEE